ncbi:TcpQ domain-containing protein [Burkholderia cepacia]|jgi:hypothetical protein|uniref:Toxin co-regulated pilus biosynthesis Q family protein n=1 Tax=Burkholderia contaminans TaxID=488447 RepID=A0ABD7YGX9_9BURK|nr:MULTISPECIES: TcpQ domain-containing protein [Burkholderia]EKS9799001.1 TcpQ domain-containing protein [Burkholderia cepacia]EKS9805955.1 TcpQ domain-containing protein [Burkholderia cepacia]EKS9813503.1 TcpQ domain-containing protein [Burkholderia cepacia]EKS9820342.1 TcpQ domain-containing protein [Burkholderia cepacia]EKS9828207.1 TcpQ domain-containing protein [Burkholderia cepacia]
MTLSFFPRVFAFGITAIVLSGCAGSNTASADWLPVSRQTTGRYVRVCPLPLQTAQSAKASSGNAASAATAPAGPGFELRTSDQTLETALTRWTTDAGATLRWQTAIKVPVPGNSRVAGDLPTAMKSILNALTEAGYPLTILGTPDGKTWIVADASDLSAAIAPAPAVAQAAKGASNAQVR